MPLPKKRQRRAAPQQQQHEAAEEKLLSSSCSPSAAASAGRPSSVETELRLDLEKAEQEKAKFKSTFDDVAEEYVCPITRELPVDPVTAEDGRIYERSAIEECIESRGDDLKSPITNQPMGTQLFPAVQARNTIERLVRSGVVSGDKAARWDQKIRDEETVSQTRRRASNDDVDAMYDLGIWYSFGMKGIPVDEAVGYRWFERVKDKGDVRGMALAGECLLKGTGADENAPYGILLLGQAANAGSDFAAFVIGEMYDEGLGGMQVDAKTAMDWYRKAVDGSCKVKHAVESYIENANARLKELEHELNGEQIESEDDEGDESEMDMDDGDSDSEGSESEDEEDD